MSLFVEAAPTVTCPKCFGGGVIDRGFCPRDCYASREPRGEGCFHRNQTCPLCNGRGLVKDEIGPVKVGDQ